MAPDEVVILCGEWETGPTPQKSSGEKYNVVLQVKVILRHPAFDAGGLGVEGVEGVGVEVTHISFVPLLMTLGPP